ncbi:hypothetical protein B296_00014801 [Ensete ventricosum]|uniref:Uncharacterized protein n=1 Tax=Ensete ventricosum TaxID=4639 RepID=A0A427AUP7_ENSVE|nr:hypothetical protein B296_00014801 [Ensete ventricosum]
MSIVYSHRSLVSACRPIELPWRKSAAEAHSPSGKLELGRSTVEPWSRQAPLDSWHGSGQRVSKVKSEKNEAKTKTEKRLTRTMGLAARSIRTSSNRVYRSVAKLRSCVSWTYFAKASPSSHTRVL